MVEEIRKSRRMISSRMTSSNHSKDMQRGNRTPTRGGRGQQTMGKSPGGEYSNNLSPFRARPMQGGAKRQSELTGRTP